MSHLGLGHRGEEFTNVLENNGIGIGTKYAVRIPRLVGIVEVVIDPQNHIKNYEQDHSIDKVDRRRANYSAHFISGSHSVFKPSRELNFWLARCHEASNLIVAECLSMIPSPDPPSAAT